MENKTIILITGANTGIGYHTALLLSSTPTYHLILSARTQEKGLSAITSIKKENPSAAATLSNIVLELTDHSTITAAAEKITQDFGRLDILINNAGLMSKKENQPEFLIENMRETFETNTLGTAAVTQAILPLLLRSPNPRLINVSTELASLTDRANPENQFYNVPCLEYRTSKAALNMFTLCIYRQYKERGLKVWTYCPGYSTTDLGRTGRKGHEERVKNGAREPEIGAQGLVDVVRGERDEEVGKFINKEGIFEW